MDDPGVWQDQAYQADPEEVVQILVDDPDFIIRKCWEAAKVGVAYAPQSNAIQSGNTLRELPIARAEYRVGRYLKIRKLAGAVNLRMAGEYLLD
jgi:hypothetical protein